ncbi:MAG TPA: preprotein translocase subunit YajC [Bacteroidetes bacterium]|nr:preprotein translocase subunit YajC [Bacteroidota bacterium]
MLADIILLQTEGGDKAAPGGQWQFLLMVGAIIVVFYFFMIRPQQKKQKDEASFRSSLGKGDRIVTIGGIYGRIVSVDDASALIEVDNGVKLKVDKAALKVAPQDQGKDK